MQADHTQLRVAGKVREFVAHEDVGSGVDPNGRRYPGSGQTCFYISIRINA
jgi:hypothetical protein